MSALTVSTQPGPPSAAAGRSSCPATVQLQVNTSYFIEKHKKAKLFLSVLHIERTR